MLWRVTYLLILGLAADGGEVQVGFFDADGHSVWRAGVFEYERQSLRCSRLCRRVSTVVVERSRQIAVGNARRIAPQHDVQRLHALPQTCRVFRDIWQGMMLGISVLTCSLPCQIFRKWHPLVGLLPRCQLVICCGAGVRLSYMYWMTSILFSGTYRCTLIDKITRQWQRTC